MIIDDPYFTATYDTFVLIDSIIDIIEAEIIDVVKVKGQLRDKKTQLLSTRDQIKEFSLKRNTDKSGYTQICDFLEAFDETTLYKNRDKIAELQNDIKILQRKKAEEETELQSNKKRVRLLDDIPCDTSFPTCKFIKDAYVSKANIPVNKGQIDSMLAGIEVLDGQVEEINPILIATKIEKYQEVVNTKNNLSNNITNYDLKIEKNESCITNLLHEIEKLEDKLSEYELNKEAIENLEGLNSQLAAFQYEEQNSEIKSEKCNDKILDLYKLVGSLEEKTKNLLEQQQSFKDLQEEFSAFDLYMRCMHPNGIAFDVIRKKLPVINEEIAKILANIVDFEIFFEDDGSRLDIFIKHAQFDPRPLEMGSGAEKTIGAMAIRLALLSVSSLPKGDIFVLDEPGTALDEDNMQGFVEILSTIKTYFKTVLLISHLDDLKDCVDMQITIDKKNGFAFVNA